MITENRESFPMTEAGYLKLQAELQHLKHVERPEVIRAIAEARERGDLSENAEYDAARELQSFIEGRIHELENVLARAKVIQLDEVIGETIKFGASVTLVDEESEEEKTYRIVGEYEADLKSNCISFASPLARALIGKKAGDAVEVNTPRGVRYYEVVHVAYIQPAAPVSPASSS